MCVFCLCVCVNTVCVAVLSERKENMYVRGVPIRSCLDLVQKGTPSNNNDVSTGKERKTEKNKNKNHTKFFLIIFKETF